MSQYEAISKVIDHIIRNKLHSHSLEDLAQDMGMSPGHLQKMFTEWVGITPKQFSRYLSLEYSKELLSLNKNSIQVAAKTGLSGGGRLHDLFVDIEAMTPGEYKNRGSGLEMAYSEFDTPFGMCLVASTHRGICCLFFSDVPGESLSELHARWPKAKIIRKQDSMHMAVREYLSGVSPTSKIKLHLQGTNFQIKVWEALLSIPEGKISTYGDIALRLGDKKLSRAVGMAVGGNPISFIIPCHRVLKSSGEISGYRWGVERKRAMLAAEAIRKLE